MAKLLALLFVVVLVLQVMNTARSRKGEEQIAPQVVYPAHIVLGVILVLFGVGHAVSKLASGGAPTPNVISGCIALAALVCVLVLGVLAHGSEGERRSRLGRAHGVCAAVMLVAIVVHVALRLA